MKKLIALVLVMAMLMSLSACGSSSNEGSNPNGLKTVKSGTLTMGTNAYFPPYEYYEGDKIVGIDAEIAQAVADKLGLELKIEDMEFDSIITAVTTGKVDMGLAGMTVTEERKQNVNFSDSYATGVQAIIVKEDSPIKTADDLANAKMIAVQLGTTGDIYCKDDFGEDHVDEYNRGNDAVMALVSDKVDAVVIDNEPAKSYVAANEGLKILDTEYVKEEYAAAISKDNDGLREAINKALSELKADGTLDKIINKYVKADEAE
ncbi:MAG: basic amino acid ABC transporter substrate-binding protein [Lachnospiraceae bacterium]|nr:basic amino acid ABC transporter substrate-binding protein [Lachnospiraceae bacterium]